MNEIGADNNDRGDADARSPPPRDRLQVPAASFPAGAGKSSANQHQQSYIALISMAILSSAERRLVLADIYKRLAYWQPDRYNAATTAWRNSIRHNLSLNECFVKAGRAANGKGNNAVAATADSAPGVTIWVLAPCMRSYFKRPKSSPVCSQLCAALQLGGDVEQPWLL